MMTSGFPAKCYLLPDLLCVQCVFVNLAWLWLQLELGIGLALTMA